MSQEIEGLVTLDNVGVSYRQGFGFFRSRSIWALQNVNFKLNRGETLGVIGRNGSGKSTLLQVLGDIIQPTVGTIVREQGIHAALLALRLGFLKHLSGRENAILSGMLMGMSKAEITKKMDEIIEFSGLEDFIDDPLFTYSTGMQMRLAFSASCQFRPDILLLDELLGVGDASFKHRSTKVMRDIVRSNATVVMVSHNLGRIRDLCDRVIWLDSGKLLHDGSPAEVLPRYQEFVKDLKSKDNVKLNKVKI